MKEQIITIGNKMRSVAYAVLIPISLLMTISCNKDFPKILKEYPTDLPAEAGRTKVLYILVDGLRGKAVQDLEPPTLKRIKRKSLYTYGALADTSRTVMTKESGWATLLTGVEAHKHGVVSDDLSLAKLTEFPTLFARVKAENKGYTSVAFTSSNELGAALTKDADNQKSFAGDDALTLQNTIQELQNGQSDIVFAQFGDVEEVGKQSSYESTDPLYADAVKEIDTKIEALITAMEKRASFEREEWLVVITSSKGGEAATTVIDNTVYGDPVRNTFTMFYSPKFAEKVLARPNSTEIPFGGNALRFTYGATPVNAKLDDVNAFNFGNDKDFTITLFIKSNIPGGNWNYPIFLSKRVEGFAGAGWNMFGEVRDGKMAWGFNSALGSQVFGTQINDGNWHSMTIVVDRTGDADSVRAFTDGVFNQGATADSDNLDNASPLAMGRWLGNNNADPDVLMANLQVYNTAFTRKEVKDLAGITHVDETHPKYSALIGYWPGYDDVGKSVLTEVTGRAGDMKITGPYNWMSFGDVVSHFKPPITYAFYRVVPNSVDISFMIYKWMGINTPVSWQLDGKSWTPLFVDIRD